MREKFNFLVIDDDEDDLELFDIAIQDLPEPVKITTFDNAKTALHELAEGLKPDAIFVDLNMPGMDGREMLKNLKARPATADIPVVIISTSSATFDMEEAKRSGAADFIIKPSNTELLTESINNFIKIKLKN